MNTPSRARAALAAAAAHVEGFFLEPTDELREQNGRPPLAPAPEPEPEPEPIEPTPPPATPSPPAPPALCPVVAVFGLARRCGGTVVARALAAELASRDQGGTAAVSSALAGGSLPLATCAAGRLAGALEDVPGATTTAVGRLCLVQGADPRALADTARHFAPLVLDAGGVEVGGAAAAVADRVVLVVSPGVEPALARVAAACVRREGAEPIVAGNRGAVAALTLPDSRMGAQLALGGRQARGELGRAVTALADLCEGPG